VKVAVTDLSASTTTEHAPLPEQAPPQEVNVESPPGVGVSVTLVPCGNDAEQVGSQLIPPGALATVPDPVPALETESVCGTSAKVAVAVLSPSIVSVQLPVPEHAPLHPLKLELAPAAGVSVTLVPLSKEAEQVPPQLIPPLSLVTVPVPLPAFPTVNVRFPSENFALTDWSLFMLNEHEPCPEQAPPQPSNVEPLFGVAIRSTWSP
jgi:hypothetical protein